jgi:hypothetical protein
VICELSFAHCRSLNSITLPRGSTFCKLITAQGLRALFWRP